MNLRDLKEDIPRRIEDGRVYEPMTVEELIEALAGRRRYITREFQGELWKDVGPATGPYSVL